MPDLEIDMHSNPFGDQDDPDNNFDQISVSAFPTSVSHLTRRLCSISVNIRRSIATSVEERGIPGKA